MAHMTKDSHRSRIADLVRSTATSATSAWRRRSQYRATVSGLESLTQRELEDIGISRDQIRSVAFNATYGQTR